LRKAETKKKERKKEEWQKGDESSFFVFLFLFLFFVLGLFLLHLVMWCLLFFALSREWWCYSNVFLTI